MQLRAWPKQAPGSILKMSEKPHTWDRCETLPFFPRFPVSESSLWKFCATSVQTRVSYKTLMCSASCIYVVMNMNLNRQCLRHTNQTTAWSKGMPEYYWTYNFGYQLWRLICMSLPFFSSFVPIPHCKCQRKVSSLLFHWSKDTSPWTTEKENDECCSQFTSLTHEKEGV